MKVRRYYRFYGDVQGVGFRYRAKYAAQMLGITGFVENCWDGSVQMEAQGTQEEIEAMLERIAESRFIRIESMQQVPMAVDERESDFLIRD